MALNTQEMAIRLIRALQKFASRPPVEQWEQAFDALVAYLPETTPRDAFAPIDATITTSTTLGTTSATYLINVGSTVTVTLPASPLEGQYIVLKDVAGGPNNITVQGNGNTIDGDTSLVLTGASYEAIRLVFDGSDWWKI